MRERLKRTSAYSLWYALRDRRAVLRWQADKARLPIPPPAAKRALLRAVGREFGLRTLVETGTAAGETPYALRRDFRRIITIEVDSHLAAAARRRFQPYAHLRVLHGDSGGLLPQVLAELDEPALFWLDGHQMRVPTASGAQPGARGERVTPVRAELAAILAHPTSDHVVLIDDARLFTGHGDYPTLDEVQQLVRSQRPKWRFEVEDDVIRLLPPRG